MVKPHGASGVQAIGQRHYDAAGSDGSIAGWQPASIAPEAETAGNEKLESRARDLFRNSPIARTIVESHVQQIMHGGISLLIQGESKQLEKIKSLVQNTIESTGLDTNKQSSFNELTALSLQETSTAGNCFALRVIDKSAPLGFRIKLLEYAYLDLSLNKSEGRNRIVRGTELDPSDCPVAYWLKPSLDAGKRGKSRRYSTDVIAHIFSPIRVGALGGVCWFAPAMTHIRMLDDILYSAQQRQATAQSFTAFVTLPHGYREDNADVIPKDKKVEKSGKGNRADERGFAKSTKADSGAMKRAIRNDDYVRGLSEIRPNTFYLLRPGEEINLAEPPAPIDLASIIKPIVMFISKCTGLSYETILGDFSNGSYSATRMSNIQPVL
ncbi:MAG TPA: phage portal protein, partial [Oligoflexus sp.]|uniref:phage portal protein n=1 Tax=Oligoflexus sp. TaxID=1971216 RepID=UPI002D390900